MKVTLQRTVDLNEVPVEIDKMMQSCATKLQTVSNIVSSIDSMDPDKFAEQVDFVRRKLFDVDNGLEECSTILQGYQNALRAKDEATSYEVEE